MSKQLPELLDVVRELQVELAALKLRLTTLQQEIVDLKQRLNTLQQTPEDYLKRLLTPMCQLLADGAVNSTAFQSPTTWAEIEDLVEDLDEVNNKLPVGLIGKVKRWLTDSRRRLEADYDDAYAVNQLKSLIKFLANLAER